MGCAKRAAARGAAARRTSCSKASGPACGSDSASSCRPRRSSARSPASAPTGRTRGRRGTTSTTSATPARSPTRRRRCRPSRSPTSPPGAQAAVIEILAALLERGRTGRGARIVVSMTHGSHRFVAHRLAGEPVPRLLTGGVACYRDLRDRRRPSPDGRCARAEVLAAPVRAARAARSRRPRLRRRPARARRALPDAHARASGSTLLEHEDTCVGPVLSLAEAAAELA